LRTNAGGVRRAKSDSLRVAGAFHRNLLAWISVASFMKRWPYWMAIIVAAGMLALPPVGDPGPFGSLGNRTYAPVWDLSGKSIDFLGLLVQCAILGCAVYVLAKSRRVRA